MSLPAVPRGVLESLRRAGLEVADRASDRLAAAHDGSHYLLVPHAVVRARAAADVVAAVRVARETGSSVTFRSGGTSLSGQAGSDALLVDTRRAFRRIEVLDDGARVRAQPGATVRQVNARLARHGRKLGPDPASEIACTIGGVVANNSSGMACGIEHNAYRTLDSLVLVLPSGTVLDTGAVDADETLREREPGLHAGLGRLRDRVRGDAEAVRRIRELHAIKNTMGYGLDSLLDHDAPADILAHLVVGSEGTLAFVAEATFRTVAIRPVAATGLLVFPDLASATAALPELVAAGFATVELLDATSLRVAQRDPEATDELLAVEVDDHAALLVEFQEPDAGALESRLAAIAPLLDRLPLAAPAVLDADPARRARLWHIRKGLFTAVAGARASGTTALLEDIAVPVDRLYAACTGLVELFARHAYRDAVIFGHAKDGNVHFLLGERFDDPLSLARYEAFTADMVDLVLGLGGTLKAEHGTGRIMAPFVRRQVGDDLYEVMREIKRLVDPDGILNPGVLLSDDPDAHVRHLKTTPEVEEEVDRCVECGYCEPVCPSRDLTTTPRERIVLRRELARAWEAGDVELARTLEREYRYDAVETCAVDGMCQTACPVLINTGDLMRRLRAEEAPALARAVGRALAPRWDLTTRVAAVALTIADAVPASLPRLATDVGRAVLGADVVPRYSGELPAGGRRRRVLAAERPEIVFFAGCTATMFGPAGGGGGVSAAFLALCARAGIAVATPADAPSLCCGTPWKSKGLTAGYASMRDLVAASLRAATDDGRLPVVCDASSCTEGLEVLLQAAGEAGIRVVDATAFAAERLLPALAARPLGRIALHPTCSSTRLGIGDPLLRVARHVARDVHIADDWGCCAFAGDRGMLHSELTASATRAEAAEVRAGEFDAHVSVNRTCELGLTRATGRPYRHVLELLEEVTRPA